MGTLSQTASPYPIRKGSTPGMRKGSTPGAVSADDEEETTAATPASGAIAVDDQTFGEFIAKLDPETKCPVPMMLLCVAPPVNPITNEPLDLGGLGVYWGDLNPEVGYELGKQSSRLWLHAGTLDFASRTQLLQAWGEGSIAARRGPSCAGSSAADFARVGVHLRALKHELLGKYCTQLHLALRQHAARVSSAMMCASAASAVEQMLLVPFASQKHLMSSGRAAGPISPLAMCEDPLASDGNTASTPSRMRRAVQRHQSVEAVAAGTGGMAAVVMAATAALAPSWDATEPNKEGGEAKTSKRKAMFKSDLTATSMLSPKADLHSVWTLPHPKHALRLLRDAVAKNSKDPSAVAFEKATAGMEAQADAAATLLQLLPLLRVRAILQGDSRADVAMPSGSAESGDAS